jgi:hypothetical protein
MSDPTRHIPRALSFADVVSRPAEQPAPSRSKNTGDLCALCRELVPHTKHIRDTLPVCSDCQRDADLQGLAVCRDRAHRGPRLIDWSSIATWQARPTLQICKRCFSRRYPGRRVRGPESNPYKDPDVASAPLDVYLSACRTFDSWTRNG